MDEGKKQEKNLRYRLIIPVSSSFFSSSSVSILFFFGILRLQGEDDPAKQSPRDGRA